MAYLRSLLPPGATLPELFRACPEIYRPLLDCLQALMRGPSPLTIAERELIAAYVSGLNACQYCRGVHTATAKAFDIPERTLAALIEDIPSAPVDDRMKPLFHYVSKLTLSPARITPGDAEEVLAAGWDDKALHDAAAVCGLFNLMNRLVDGLGITADEQYFAAAARGLADAGYTSLL